MTRSEAERVRDILDATSRCERFVALLDRHRDDEDLVAMAEDAIERNLQVIGEAASHLSADFTAARPDVPWPQIRGFRNILVHQYFGVDVDIVRDVVQNHLPVLVAALQA